MIDQIVQILLHGVEPVQFDLAQRSISRDLRNLYIDLALRSVFAGQRSRADAVSAADADRKSGYSVSSILPEKAA